MKVKGKGHGSVHESLEQLRQNKNQGQGAAKSAEHRAPQAATHMNIHEGVAKLLENDELEAQQRAEKVKLLAQMYKEHGTIEYDSKEVAEKLLADIGELGFISQALSDGE